MSDPAVGRSSPPTQLRRRWILSIAGLVGSFAVVSTIASFEIGLWGALTSGEEWLRSNSIEATAAYESQVFDQLDHHGHELLHDHRVLAAFALGDYDALAVALRERRGQAWILVTPEERVLTGLPQCAGLPSERLRAVVRDVLVCDGIPILAAAAAPFPDADTLPAGTTLLVTRRMDTDAYLDGLKVAAKSEVGLAVDGVVLSSSARDLAGGRMPFEIDRSGLAALEPAGRAVFLRAMLYFPRKYHGFEPGHTGRRFGAGAVALSAFVLDASTGVGGESESVRLLFFIPREVLEIGPTYAALTLVGISLLTLVVLLWAGWRLVRRFTAPLETLAEAATRAGEGDLDVRVPVAGDAELVELGESFNAMLVKLSEARSVATERAREAERHAAEREAAFARLKEAHEALRDTQEQLVDASRRAGMAEVAAGVLHDVGNVLNSVNVSAALIAEGIQGSKVERVVPAVEMLDKPPTELARFLATDAHGRQVVPYLRELGRHIAAERAHLLVEVQALRGHIAHVNAVVATQRAYAGSTGVAECCYPNVVVEEAVQMALPPEERVAAGVQLALAAERRRPLDRHRLARIVVNLVANAGHAVAALPEGTRRVVVRAYDEEEALVVEVEDNGAGIPPENLTRVFAHGFTTRAEGQGFGLHTSALAAADLGGTLRCQSEGRGRGARFRLTIPTRPGHEPRCA